MGINDACGGDVNASNALEINFCDVRWPVRTSRTWELNVGVISRYFDVSVVLMIAFRM